MSVPQDSSVLVDLDYDSLSKVFIGRKRLIRPPVDR